MNAHKEPMGYVIGYVDTMLTECGPMTIPEITEAASVEFDAGDYKIYAISRNSIGIVLHRLNGKKFVRTGEKRRHGVGRPHIVWRAMTSEERGAANPEALMKAKDRVEAARQWLLEAEKELSEAERELACLT